MSSVAVTAADRAAATCQRWVPHSLRGDRAKVSKGRSQSPLVVPERHETLTCGGYAATPCRLPQKEDHPQQWMVEDIPLRCSKALSRRKGLSSVSLTADCSLCRGSLLAPPPAKPPLKGEVPAIGGRRGSFPQRRQVTIPIVDAPTLRRNHLCRSPQVKRQPLFGREGSGGRGASLREAASPPSVPPSLRGGSAREGSFSTEKLPSLAYPLFFDFFCNVIGGETVMNEEFLGVGGGLTEYVGNGDRL